MTQYDKGGAPDLAHRIAEGVLKGAIPEVTELGCIQHVGFEFR